MGVYYQASIVYGILLDERDDDDWDPYDLIRKYPGFDVDAGGNFMTSEEPTCHVLHIKGHKVNILDSSGYNNYFGVHELDAEALVIPVENMNRTLEVADEVGGTVGFYIVSSVG